MDNKKEIIKLLEFWEKNWEEGHFYSDPSHQINVSKTSIANTKKDLEIHAKKIFGNYDVNVAVIQSYIDEIKNEEYKQIEHSLNLIQCETIPKQTKLLEQQTKILKDNLKWFILLGLITLAIGGLGLWLSNVANNIQEMQANISKVQTEILERSSPPYEAYIEIVPDIEDLEIPAWELTDLNFLNNRNPYHGAIIDLTTYNFGKMGVEKVYCRIGKPKGFMIHQTPSSIKIDPESFNLTTLKLFSEECNEAFYNNNTEICKRPNLISSGYYNITLSCDCVGCKTQRNFNTTINFCVYSQNKDQDCQNSLEILR